MNKKVNSPNIDHQVVNDFGNEWARFDQSGAPVGELEKSFERYFSLFPWDIFPKDAVGFDLGCGSGRWAFFCAPRVGMLHCIDPAESALNVARKKLSKFDNCVFHVGDAENIPLEDNSMDFGYSLGVLHHIPDTKKGISDCVKKLKPKAPFLLYIYYAFDNRSIWFKAIWKVSDLMRRAVSILPNPAKYFISEIIALLIYFPLSRLSRIVEYLGANVENIPLSAYRDKSFYTLRTDALDRFGTRLERRFTKLQIQEMLVDAGLERIQFSDESPYWCVIGYKY